nr:L-fucose isomerase [Gallibacterium genomosp. 3]
MIFQLSKLKETSMQSTKIKIGIRPTIDGRRMGVRESLEEQTMNMAKSVADLLQTQVRHADGQFVECVIADTCIGGVAEAAACAEKFKLSNVGVVITVTPCWCYGSETIDMDPHMPKAIWGFNGTERPGAVYLAAALAGHTQMGLPAFSIYGTEVQEADDTTIPEDVKEKLLRFARAGLVVASIRGKSYLSIGSVSMGIAGSIVDQPFFQHYLGMRNEYVDMTEIKRRLDRKIYDEEEVKLALSWVKQYCKEGIDTNKPEFQRSAAEKEELWENVVKMTIIARDLMVGNPKLAELNFGEEALGHNAIAAGFQGQRQWTDHLPNGDFMEAILNSTYDWNGVRPPFIMATENDSLNGITMLLANQLTGQAQIFADVRTYWSQDSVERVTGFRPEQGFLHLLNSGSAALDGTGQHQNQQGEHLIKPVWEVTEEDGKRCVENTRWCAAVHEYFRGGGLSSQFLTKGGLPFTMSRINLVKGLGPVLQLAEGWSIELPTDVHDTLSKRTNETWPCTWFVPRLTGKGAFKDVYSVMANWGANHCVVSYGHIGADLITLASMLRIPVCMHNIEDEAIFRPSAWSAFGQDKEGQDYRACQNFGPLYK